MHLTTTTQKVQVLLDATATTTELPIVASFVDHCPGSALPGSSNTITTGATAVDVVAAPAADNRVRRVVGLTVYNADTANRTVTVRYNDNGTTRIIVKILLTPGQSLTYSPNNGWQVVTATQAGANKASFLAHKNGTDQTGIATATLTKITFGTEVFDTGNYYDAANSKWTPPAGVVSIQAAIDFSAGLVDQNNVTLYLYKNGVAYKTNFLTESGTGATSPSIAVVDSANGTDYYEIYGAGYGAGNKTAGGSFEITFFSGTML